MMISWGTREEVEAPAIDLDLRVPRPGLVSVFRPNVGLVLVDEGSKIGAERTRSASIVPRRRRGTEGGGHRYSTRIRPFAI